MHSALAAVRAAEHAALRINLAGERIAAALREHLEHFGLRMIAPDVLALEAHIFRHAAADVPRRRAANRAVNPTIRPKLETARHRVRVLQPEAAQTNLRVRI